MKRIDAHLSSLGYCTRGESRAFLQEHTLFVNGSRTTDPSQKANHKDILLDGEPLDPSTLLIALHKPKGFVCSHSDGGVLIYSLLPSRWLRRNPKLATIGRLDADTTGLVLLTDDGALNHRLSSPKGNKVKVYEVELADELRGDEAEIFGSGTMMLNGEIKPLLPAKLEYLNPKKVQLEIVEGRYHQVKRMFGAVGNRVVALHRIQFGEFLLNDLKEGEFVALGGCRDEVPAT